MVLDVIGTVYSGDKRMLYLGLTIVSAVVMQCRQNGYLKRSASEIDIQNIKDRAEVENMWDTWSREESCRRLAYGVWVRFPLSFFLSDAILTSSRFFNAN